MPILTQEEAQERRHYTVQEEQMLTKDSILMLPLAVGIM